MRAPWDADRGGLREAGLTVDVADIDAAALALGHPMGPFELMDLVALDVIRLMHAAEAEMTGDEARGPHPLLVALVDEGRLGRKAGRGWYEYGIAT